VNPYVLPEGNVQIAFSGGRTSAFMLHSILEANRGLPERAEVIFSNTGREMPETLDFVQACSDHWSVPITWIEYRNDAGNHSFDVVNHNSASRDGEPFEMVVAKKGYLPNRVARFCTADLKIRPASKYLVQECGWTRWHTALGIRADEPLRVRPSSEARLTAWFPLNDAGVTKADVTAFWARQSFDLELQNIGGRTPLGNCDGCFLKSEANRAALAREHPDRFNWWVRMEEMSNSTFRPAEPYSALGNFVSEQGDWVFDDTAYLCQVDGGECTA
jgi:3'-phosphoadenosine 5'-phosphosulfate sulfotransferase (PAPS reductase)/FAD synthetase